MPFPDSPRVIYAKNPLETVICQLRFPTILKIDTEIPSVFQEKIRFEYPLYEEKLEGNVDLPIDASVPIPQELKNLLAAPGIKKNHSFSSEDGLWTINLTSSFLAVTTRKYDRWENFRSHLLTPLIALKEVYSPAFFSRIGLRYRDVIRRNNLGLGNNAWSDLLQPYIAGILGAPGVPEKNVVSTANNIVIRLADRTSVVRIVHGLAEEVGKEEPVYLIDSDFYNETRTESNNAISKLDFFNERGSRLIRWCITDRLHTALDPQPIQ